MSARIFCFSVLNPLENVLVKDIVNVEEFESCYCFHVKGMQKFDKKKTQFITLQLVEFGFIKGAIEVEDNDPVIRNFIC